MITGNRLSIFLLLKTLEYNNLNIFNIYLIKFKRGDQATDRQQKGKKP